MTLNTIQYKEGMTIEAPCLIVGMPNDVYHATSAISKSGLDKINRSPAHYRYAAPMQPTRAMAMGSAIHAAVLEPEIFSHQYLLLRDVTDRRSSEYKQAIKSHDAEFVLTGSEAVKVKGMQDAIYSNTATAKLFEGAGWNELSVFAHDPETGALCKCRFDRLTADMAAVDLKKTQDASERAFSRTMANYRYHVQAAFYTDVFKWATGIDLERFVFVATEEEFPHYTKPWRVADDSYLVGRDEYRNNLNLYAECAAAGEWPLPDGSEEFIFLPEWMQPMIGGDL